VLITIAICTWNRCPLLRQTLERLTDIAASGVEWEVLVVDNNSTDQTQQVAERFRGVLPLRVVFEGRPGLSHARNRAMLEARGDYIAWIDDDVLVAEQWLGSLVAAIRRFPDADAFGGPIDPWFPTPPEPAVLSAFPILAKGFCGLDYGQDETVLRPDQHIHGANMTFAARAIRGLRFDPALGTVAGSGLSGEDFEFLEQVRARGGTVRWVPAMRVSHYVDPSRMTVAYLSRFYRDRGRTLVRRSGSGDVPHLLGVPRWCWRAMAVHYARYSALRFTPLRRQALESLREFQFVRGVVSESRVQRRRALA
jgi:glycosyltransferase involved in cell wall biosynthesis